MITFKTPNKYFTKNNTSLSQTKYIYLGSTLVGIIENSTISFPFTDHLGSTDKVTDPTGNIIESTDYYPYGKERIHTGGNTKRRFIGQEYDADTGLNYLNARYYNGSIGRFISQDPSFLALGDTGRTQAMTGMSLEDVLRDPQSLNSYSYAGNNPITRSDPTGKWYKEFLANLNPASFGRGQSWGGPNGFQMELGQATMQLTQDSPTWDYAVSNPKTAGALVGVLAAPAAEAGVSAVIAAQAAGAVGVGTAYAAKQATAAAVYGIVTAGSLQAIPQTLGVLGKTDTTNQSKYGSTIWNVGSQIGPTVAGGYIGAISDVVQFVQTIGNNLTNQSASSNQSNANSSSKKLSK